MLITTIAKFAENKMKKDKMIEVRLLNDGNLTELKHLSFPMDVYARIQKNRKGIEVNESSFGLVFNKFTTNNGWVYFMENEYELITEEDPTPQQQTIEQLLVTRNKHKDDIEKKRIMIIDIDTEIIDRLAPIGYSIAVFK